MSVTCAEGVASFATLGLIEPLTRALTDAGLVTPMPIQAAAIPALLAGRDVLGQSRTGSGKTLAFALPVLQNVRLNGGTQAIILVPTRELCAQVTRAVRRFGCHLRGLRVLEVAGGQPFGPQARALYDGVHVVVGTPGRVLDHLRRETLDLRSIDVVVLDEADRMLDMGFGADIEQVLQTTPNGRQTVLFSATFSDAILAVSTVLQRDPKRITVAGEPGGVIRQIMVETSSADRIAALLAVLTTHRPASAVVFCNQKVTVAEVTAALRRAGHRAEALSGDLEQFDRDRVMAKLRNGSTPIVVATDVAARGLDLVDLDVVINYELPADPETYLHRIGRTGRAGAAGLAVSLASERDRGKIARIEGFTGVPVEREAGTGGAVGVGTSPDVGTAVAVALPEMRTLRIGGGRKDKLRAGDILGALTGEAGLVVGDIGKIEIHDDYAYVAIRAESFVRALEWFADGRIKGKRFRGLPSR